MYYEKKIKDYNKKLWAGAIEEGSEEDIEMKDYIRGHCNINSWKAVN